MQKNNIIFIIKVVYVILNYLQWEVLIPKWAINCKHMYISFNRNTLNLHVCAYIFYIFTLTYNWNQCTLFETKLYIFMHKFASHTHTHTHTHIDTHILLRVSLGHPIRMFSYVRTRTEIETGPTKDAKSAMQMQSRATHRTNHNIYKRYLRCASIIILCFTLLLCQFVFFLENWMIIW